MKNTLTLIVILSLLTLFQSCFNNSKKVKLDINNEAKIKEYMQGKWEWVRHGSTANSNQKYRFQIEGNQLKIWYCSGNTKDAFDMSNAPKIHPFTLSSPTRSVDGYKCRYLDFDESNVSAEYVEISPILIIIDEQYWDKPEMMCSSGVIPWDRAKF